MLSPNPILTRVTESFPVCGHVDTSPVGILTGHEGNSGGRARGLDIILIQENSFRGQALESWTVNIRIVPGNIIPTLNERCAMNDET